MKKSQFITIFIMFIIASVLICIGCFLKTSPGEEPSGATATDNGTAILPTIKPMETEIPEGTGQPEDTAGPDATEAPTEVPTEEPTETPAQPVVFPTIKNADFVQYNSKCEHFSTRWQTGADNQNRAVIQDYVLEMVKDVDYVFYTIESDTAWDNYMTFSLHYEYGYTAKTLDLLKDYNIKAVFFVSEQYIKENPDLVRRMKEEGHLIGNRGVVGDSNIEKLTAEAFAEGLLAVEAEYRKLFGESERMYLFRTDYFSTRLLKVAEAMGYTVVFRTYTYYSDAEDFKNRSAADLCERFNERAAYNGSVSEFTVEEKCYEALKLFIPNGVDENINFRLIERRR